METNKYRTSGIFDENTYRELSRFSVTRWRVWFFRVCSVLLALLALFMLIVREYHYTVLSSFFAVLFAFTPMMLRKLYVRSAIKLIKETYPDGYIRMETFFNEEGVVLHNLSSGAQGVLAYGVLRQVAETEHYFYVSTKARQFTLVFKDLLTQEQKKSFLPFLREKCPNIKVVR